MADQSNPVAPPGPRLKINISHYPFSIPSLYSPGHPLTAEEAEALNALRARRIRNVAERWVTTAQVASGDGLLDSAQIAEIQQRIETYAATYSFSSRPVYSGTLFDTELLQVAREWASKRSTTNLEWEGHFDSLSHDPPEELQQEARRRLAAKLSVLDPDALGI